jgi:hypothetical protein
VGCGPLAAGDVHPVLATLIPEKFFIDADYRKLLLTVSDG